MLLLEPCPDPLPRSCSTDTTVPVPYPTPFSPIFKPGARLPRTKQRTFFKRSVSDSDYTSCCERPALAQPRPRGPSRLANSTVRLQSNFDNAAKQNQPSLRKDHSQDKLVPRVRDKDSTRSPETQGNRSSSTAKPCLRLDLAQCHTFPIIESVDTPTTPQGRTAPQSPSKLLPHIYSNLCSFLTKALQNHFSPTRNSSVFCFGLPGLSNSLAYQEAKNLGKLCHWIIKTQYHLRICREPRLSRKIAIGKDFST
jgi:hypothetical protein